MAAPAPVEARHRVIVSSDIGGTDPDDFQSMAHFLLYADRFDVEGIISSPYGPGRKSHILQVIDHYERDYPALLRHSARYPKPADLRSMSNQGALESPGFAGVGSATEGSEWIVQCARRKDPRPLYLLVWGGLEDLAQALHDAPDILPKLRVYFIGGPNKMWSADAYHYIEQNHPKLWMIESNATYRGWFTGGNQEGVWGNREFIAQHVAGRGALGEFLASHLKGVMKMGDSPSVSYLLHGDPALPEKPGWGGQYVRIWDGRLTQFDRLTTEEDRVEAFGVVQFALPAAGLAPQHSVKVVFDNRVSVPVRIEPGRLLFRFSPRDAKVWSYVVQSDFAPLHGLAGRFTAEPPPPDRTRKPSARHPHWWTDDPSPQAAEGVHPGARSVSRWREEFLRDFAETMKRTTVLP